MATGMRTTIVVTGTDEAAAKLMAVAAATNGAVLNGAVMTAALIIVDDAKRRAPFITGNLRRSIHAEAGETTATSASATVGTDVEYAARIEFGFVGFDSLHRHYNQAAQPYLRPALDENEEKIQAAVEAVVAAAIASVIG